VAVWVESKRRQRQYQQAMLNMEAEAVDKAPEAGLYMAAEAVEDIATAVLGASM
jgi:hypothetical protein